MRPVHYSVLLEEVLNSLNIKEDGIYVDATLGYAGCSKEILKRIKNGKLFAFDADSEAVDYSKEVLSSISENFKIFNTNFKNLKEVLNDEGVFKVDGIIFDLGLSSPQIDNAKRGFSFMNDGPLDMRFSNEGKTAREILNTYSEDELKEIFLKYGEEKTGKTIASSIVKKRRSINSTLDLADVIKEAVGSNYFYKHHPERKIFQALRIEVNDELNVLEKALNDAVDLLNPGGRLAVISFHSLEDRIVKTVFRKYSEIDEMVKGLPNIPEEYLPVLKMVNKSPVLPLEKELLENPRSKSAKLRIGEKL